MAAIFVLFDDCRAESCSRPLLKINENFGKMGKTFKRRGEEMEEREGEREREEEGDKGVMLGRAEDWRRM